MRHLKLLFRAVIILFVLNSNAHYLNNYESKVKEYCLKVNSLALKKSVIAMLRSEKRNCNDQFTTSIISNCHNQLSCNNLYDWLAIAREGLDGNVIGAQ